MVKSNFFFLTASYTNRTEINSILASGEFFSFDHSKIQNENRFYGTKKWMTAK